MEIKAVLFDVIGTTVLEARHDVIPNCFVEAFLEHGIDVSPRQITLARGHNKLAAIEMLLAERGLHHTKPISILKSFHKNVLNNLHHFSEHLHFGSVVHYLKDRNIFTGVSSGLPEEAFHLLVDKLQWSRYELDFIKTYDHYPQGRPAPHLINDLLHAFQLSPRNFLKVGDTMVDVEEGRNSGVYTAAILSGTQPAELLKKAKPDFLLDSLLEVTEII